MSTAPFCRLLLLDISLLPVVIIWTSASRIRIIAATKDTVVGTWPITTGLSRRRCTSSLFDWTLNDGGRLLSSVDDYFDMTPELERGFLAMRSDTLVAAKHMARMFVVEISLLLSNSENVTRHMVYFPIFDISQNSGWLAPPTLNHSSELYTHNLSGVARIFVWSL